jgi:hypothetical protein
MAWSIFQLGRPGNEITFDINPNTLEIRPAQIAATARTLSGHLRKWVFRTNYPTITMNSDWFTVADYNAMQSLLAITDTMLSFKIRDGDLQTIAEICYQTDQNTVPIRENSQTLLSAALVAAGAAGSLTINRVNDNPTDAYANTGTDYYAGGSYADATGIITLGTPLLLSTPVYVTYSYTGYLVSMEEIGAQFIGGQVDLGKVSGWILTGV